SGWTRSQRSRTGPLLPLNSEAGRNCGERILADKTRRLDLLDGASLFGKAMSLALLSGLQIAIDKIIHGVQALIPRTFHMGFDFIVAGSGGRGKIGPDGFLPQSQPDKDMRWHVLGMRDTGRDLGIAACRRQGMVGEHRVVVGVDDVMRHAGM